MCRDVGEICQSHSIEEEGVILTAAVAVHHLLQQFKLSIEGRQAARKIQNHQTRDKRPINVRFTDN